MAKDLPIQHSFTAGEVSPLVELRHDLDMIPHAARIMENFFTHIQGPAETRSGSEFVWDVPGLQGRIFPFYVSTFVGFVVIITTDFVYVSDQNGYISLDDLMSNGDFLDAGAGWVEEESGTANVTFIAGACILSPGNPIAAEASIRQNSTVIASEPHTLTIQIVNGTGPMVVRIGNTELSGDIYEETHAGSATIILEDLVAVGTDMWIQLEAPGSELTKVIDKVTLFNTEGGPPEPITFPSPWTTNTELASIQAKMPPGEIALYFSSQHVAPQVLDYDRELRDWDFAPLEFTDAKPPEWVNSNWPVAIEFFDGRLYLCGTVNEPEDWWASSTRGYGDWNLNTGENAVPLPEDAMHYTLPRRGAIRWVLGSRVLVMGTEIAEFIITSEGGLLIPGDVQQIMQSTYGSIGQQAIESGNSILFISPDGRKVRSMNYEWTKEAWSAIDITMLAEHITANGDQVTQIHYAANPRTMLVGTTALGNLITCTYDPNAQGGGWHRQNTQGVVKGTCVLPYAGRDEVWVLVDRDEEGPALSLERSFAGGEPLLKTKLDSYKRFNFTEPTSTLTGLEHLANMECQIIADGAVHPNRVVEADGTCELQIQAMSAVIGLGYLSRLVTLPRDDSISTGQLSQGSARSAKKRWNKIYVRIVESWMPKINGQRPPERHAASLMDLIEPPETKNVQVSLRGWDEEAVVIIEQDLPVPTIVAGIFGELEQEV